MKKLFKLFILSSFIFMLSGCLKSEDLDKATIYTTTYPVEYIVNELYGYNSTIKSIYPEGIDINKYSLSNKKIKKYSKGDLFVYNGLTDEKKIAADFVNKNSKLKIIDVSEGLAIKHSYQELWLNPTNYLMLAQNVKNGLRGYIENTSIKDEIKSNYEKFKVTVSEFETELNSLSKNGDNKILVVSKDYFKFLENYGFEVISLEETDELSNDVINRVKNLLNEKKVKYIFVSDEEASTDKYSDTINDVLKSGGTTKTLNTMTILTSEQKKTNENYVSLMKENIENLKAEVYK